MDDLSVKVHSAAMEQARSTAERLLILQEYVGAKTQQEMADMIGIGLTSWNHALTSRELSKRTAFEIVRRFPEITLEWLWFGEQRHLTLKTLQELQKAEQRLRR